MIRRAVRYNLPTADHIEAMEHIPAPMESETRRFDGFGVLARVGH
jgi:hypothetical protein